MNLFRRLVFIITVSLVFCGCKDWAWWPYGREGATKLAKGSIYENLEKRGDFSLFLQALDITGYKIAVDKSELLTVFAPNDAAFREFMTNELGVSNLSEVVNHHEKFTKLKRVITFHIVKFSYTVDDFLGFTTSANPEAPRGDGTVYKYQTLARDPLRDYKDPLSHREVQLYKKEKYLPVFSTKLFETKKSPNAEEDYRKMYPTVNWKGSNNRLYVGEAAVLEQGIPADNGYVYTIDKVALPRPTIYDLLDEQADGILAENHRLFMRMIERMNRYTYDADISKLYAIPGDSLFHHYTYDNPGQEIILPQVADEWTYNSGDGPTNIQRSMSYANTAIIPSDEAMEAWIRENLSEWVLDRTMNEVIDVLPRNTLYHILIAHLFGKRPITIPSELIREGVTGVYGETDFQFDENQIEDIQMAANGIAYAVDKANTSVVFKSFTRPLFTTSGGKTYRFFAEGFNAKNMYQNAAEKTDYTLFVVNDANLESGLESGIKDRVIQNSSDPLKVKLQEFKNNNWNDYGVEDLSLTMAKHLSYGFIPSPDDVPEEDWSEYFSDGATEPEKHYLRFYKMRRVNKNGAATYLYQLNGEFYDETGEALGYSEAGNITYSSRDADSKMERGIVHEISRKMSDRGEGNIRNTIRAYAGQGNPNREEWKPGAKFKKYLMDCGIVRNDGEDFITGGWNATRDLIMFFPSNEAIEAAEAQGVGTVIPFFDPNDSTDMVEFHRRRQQLEDWCKFYIFDRFSNVIEHYPLQGLDPKPDQTPDVDKDADGYSLRYNHLFRTAISYSDLNDAKYCRIGWDKDDCMRMFLENKNGERAYTTLYWPENPASPGEPELMIPNLSSDVGIVYIIDKCFPYSSMTAGEF